MAESCSLCRAAPLGLRSYRPRAAEKNPTLSLHTFIAFTLPTCRLLLAKFLMELCPSPLHLAVLLLPSSSTWCPALYPFSSLVILPPRTLRTLSSLKGKNCRDNGTLPHPLASFYNRHTPRIRPLIVFVLRRAFEHSLSHSFTAPSPPIS